MNTDKIGNIYWLGYDVMKLSNMLYTYYFRTMIPCEDKLRDKILFQFFQVVYHMEQVGLDPAKVKIACESFEFGQHDYDALGKIITDVNNIAVEIGCGIHVLQPGFDGGNERNPYWERVSGTVSQSFKDISAQAFFTAKLKDITLEQRLLLDQGARGFVSAAHPLREHLVTLLSKLFERDITKHYSDLDEGVQACCEVIVKAIKQ